MIEHRLFPTLACTGRRDALTLAWPYGFTPPSGIVYLYHFSRPIAHAQHYIGWTLDLAERDYLHQTGQGARLLQVALERGISFEIVRTWPGDRKFERKLKNRHDAAPLCPICRNARKQVRWQLGFDDYFLDVFTLADVSELTF